jgi:hypothetical protein
MTNNTVERPIAVLIITNGGNKKLLEDCYNSWSTYFQPGVELYVSGPNEILNKFGFIERTAVVDYSTDAHSHYGSYFINKKKYFSAKNISSKYLLFIHERIVIDYNIKLKLLEELKSGEFDFGCCQVLNTDGSLSVGPLYLDDQCMGLSLIDALILKKRLVSKKKQRYNLIGLNGAQFFIKREYLHFLNSQFAWGEMEDDILSFELKDKKGVFLNDVSLRTVSRKNWLTKSTLLFKINLSFYLLLCRLLSYVVSLLVRITSKHTLVISAASKPSYKLIESLEAGKKIIFIDPMHKRFFTEEYGISFEKLSTILRASGKGRFIENSEELFYGWKLVS